ncbi:MAG TPA: DinB family protein [Treponemataceae bacterium]|jgi:uncharacterized damage-inducible protein DinB|nr:hypothetical protein [Mollicutes bacterium]HOF86284.1 DinB family protein [Treponemataceae bacterium]
MKELFLALSTYNQKTNRIIYDLLKNISKNDFDRSLKCYYKNIGENIIHVIRSDIKWLQRFSVFTITEQDNKAFEIINKSKVISGETIVNNFVAFYDLRITLDSKIIDFIKNIKEEEYLMKKQIAFGSQNIELELWKLLLQWLNHQTHHRGQLSIQLEIIGIENDFSKIIDKI